MTISKINDDWSINTATTEDPYHCTKNMLPSLFYAHYCSYDECSMIVYEVTNLIEQLQMVAVSFSFICFCHTKSELLLKFRFFLSEFMCY